MGKSQEKLSTILLHDPVAGGLPASNYLMVRELGVGGKTCLVVLGS